MQNKDAKIFYNEKMPEKFGADYEERRWFKDPIQKAGYDLTKKAIERHVLSDETQNPLRALELGPGAGTWTKLLVKRFPDTYFDLLDISKEMLNRARGALGNNDHVQYHEGDILDWSPSSAKAPAGKPEGPYDFFFSSRVLEYIDDKKGFAQKVFSLLEPGSRGFLITKMPHYERERFLGRKTSDFHRCQIAPAALMDTLRKAGFIYIDCFSVTVSGPLIHSAKINLWLGKLLGPFRLGLFGMFFAESYCVLFRKPTL